MVKPKVRLTNEEATYLGLEIKPRNPNRHGNPTYSISREDEDRLIAFRDGHVVDNKVSAEPKKKSDPKPFILSAWKDNGGVMNIKEYCSFHSLPYDDVRSYKLVSHTGIPFYNIQFKEKLPEDVQMSADEIKEILYYKLQDLKADIKYKKKSLIKSNVATLADIHFGAVVEGLIRTEDFNPKILANKLRTAAYKINDRNAEVNHVHILGDLIESFTGLNHKNSWKSLDKNLIGAEAITGCVKMLHENLLSKIHNLGCIKIVAGNHDRVTSAKDEDQDGDAAKLIAWGLELMGYDVEFNSDVITHVVEDIAHILMHGEKSVSKKSTAQIILDYGVPGKYNLIKEGHLHSHIEKLPETQLRNFNMVKDAAVDRKRIIFPSIFTGNNFSERLGFTSGSGFANITAFNGVPELDYRGL